MQTRRIASIFALTALLLPAVLPVAAADAASDNGNRGNRGGAAAEAGAPSHAGPPADAGAPDHAGPPSDAAPEPEPEVERESQPELESEPEPEPESNGSSSDGPATPSNGSSSDDDDDDEAQLVSGPGGNCPTANLLYKIDGVSSGTTHDLGALFGDTYDGVTIEVLNDSQHSVEVAGGTVELCLKAGPGHTDITEVDDGGSYSVGGTDLRVGARDQSIPSISNIAIYSITPTATESTEEPVVADDSDDDADDPEVPVVSDDSDDDADDTAARNDDSPEGDDPIVIEDEPTVLGAVVAPEAGITWACVAEDGAIAVDLTLDNAGSTTEVDYTVAFGDGVERVSVGALDAVTRSHTVDADDGDVEVVVTAGDAVLASQTLSVAEECDTGVLGVVEDKDDDTAPAAGAPQADAQSAADVEVLGETIEQTGLPRTGVSALLLALAGLTALVAGGGLLATRRKGMAATQ